MSVLWTRMRSRAYARFHHSVAVLPFPFPYPVAVAVAAAIVPWLVGVDDWLASYGTTEKIELDPISTEER